MKISDSGDSIQNTGKRANGRGHNTSIDVAKLAGVSQATVSRAFNPASKMNPSTRQRVLDAASALKYAPDAIARSLISNSTNIVAVIMQNTTNPFYATVLSKLSIRLRSMGKQILFFYLDDEGHMKDLIHQILQYRVDGILITSATLTSDLADTCVDFGVPVVLFNRYMNTPGIQAVCCDNVQAGRDCADYFFMKGYRSFAFIGGHDEASTSHDRRRGFVSRLEERGIHDCPVINTPFTYEGGREGFRRLLEQEGTCPKALFCVSDLVCAGVLDCARSEYGLRVPEDAAVIGFDDIELASYSAYSITSFVQPMDSMIDRVLDLLLSEKQPSESTNLTLFPCTLKTRGTA